MNRSCSRLHVQIFAEEADGVFRSGGSHQTDGLAQLDKAGLIIDHGRPAGPVGAGTPDLAVDNTVNRDVFLRPVGILHGKKKRRGNRLGTEGHAGIEFVPVFGLLSSGAYTLDQHTIHAPLTKKAAN